MNYSVSSGTLNSTIPIHGQETYGTPAAAVEIINCTGIFCSRGIFDGGEKDMEHRCSRPCRCGRYVVAASCSTHFTGCKSIKNYDHHASRMMIVILLTECFLERPTRYVYDC